MADTILLEQHYHTLHLKLGDSLRAVRRSYRRLAHQFHPDHGGSAEKMQRINAACDAVVAAIMNGTAPEPVKVRKPVQKKTVDRSDFIPARAKRVEFGEPGMTTVTVGFHWSPEQIEAARLALR